jgi:hypothetical protein
MTAPIGLLLIAGALLLVPPAGVEGMPSPTPSKPDKVYHLNDSLRQTTTVGVHQ